MLLLALHLATASIIQPAVAPSRPELVLANPDGGKKRRDGTDDEDVR
ncbi:MAG: hypothetical protein Q8N26_09845 [Myxococcales bacterium]|nr:hypothetical protein [Myxococcales bacterium]